MKNRTRMAIVCLHLSAMLYVFLFAVGIYLMWLIPDIQENDPYAYYLALILIPLGLTLAIISEWVARGLRQQKFWAWIAGLFIFILFLPIGVFGLWGLLAQGSRQSFGIGR